MALTLVGVVLVIYFSQSSRDVSAVEEPAPLEFEAWVVNESTAAQLQRLAQELEHMQLDIRRFRSPDQLYEALIAAVSVNDAPELAEVNSLQNLEPLIDSGALQPVDAERYGVQVAEKWRTYFSVNEELWAVPISAAVPVLYYNGDWLRFGGVVEPQRLTTWPKLIDAARKRLQSLPMDRAAYHWGLVADDQYYWYWLQMAPNSTPSETLAALRTWHRMVHDYAIMPPISHYMAATSFVGNRVGFYLTSSDMRGRLEPYIGGKFKFGILPLPETGDLVAKVDGLAVLAADEATRHEAMLLAARMTEQPVQEALFLEYGKLMVRDDPALAAHNLDEMQQVLLALSERVRPIARTDNPVLMHERYTMLLEQVELMEDGWDESALRDWMARAGLGR
jgi:ABC-type glycerol-3-phosphate transport system substrate-binding protein